MVVVPAASPRSAVASREGSHLRALVIDRQPLFLAALGNLLQAPPLCADVHTTLRSDAGLEMSHDRGFDLIFCELRSEPLSGTELIAALVHDHIDIPVILLGDAGDESDLAIALDANAAGLFTKDAALHEFLAGVEAVASGHRAIGSGLLGRLIGRVDQQRHDTKRFPGQLSPTELEILVMIGHAQSIPAIAASRGISHKTVRNHLAKIYRKLELHGRTEAVLWAARMGLTEA